MDARELLVELTAAASSHDLEAVSALGRHERLTESFRRMHTAFPDARVTVEWSVLEGSRAVGWAHITGTHQGVWRGLEPTGRPIDVHGVLAISMGADGGVEDFWLANDWLGIATQIGVPLALP